MKRIVLFTVLVSMLFGAVSCQREIIPNGVTGDVNVRFSVELPAAPSTRAIADGTNVDILYYEIWSDNDGQLDKRLAAGTKERTEAKLFDLDLTLVSDQTYHFLFWAQVNGKDYYDATDLTAVKVNYTYKDENGTDKPYAANDESRAAFFAKETFTVTESFSETVTLKRPFAQLNFGTTTLKSDLSDNVVVNTSKVTVSEAATVFNVAAGVGSEPTSASVVFDAAAIPNDPTLLTVNNVDYHYLSMNYFLVDGESNNISVSAEFATEFGTVSHSIVEVPVAENYRTNILGDLLFSKADLKIVVDEDFVDGEGKPNPDKNVYVVSDQQDLKDILENAPEGETIEVVLESNMDFTVGGATTLSTFAAVKTAPTNYALWLPEGKSVILNLNGYNITCSSEVAGGGFIYNEGQLVITGEGTVAYTYKGTPDSSYGKGNQTIDNRGILTVDGEKTKIVNSSAAMSHAAYAVNTNAGATFNLKNGEIRHENGHAIRMVSFGTASNNVNIEGGYILGERALQVHLPSSASAAAPEMNLNVSGGVLESDEETYNLAIYVISNGQSAEKTSVNISGGTFNGNVAINGAASNTMNAGAVTITGGTFNGDYGVFSYADEAADVINIQRGEFRTLYSTLYLDSEDETYVLANDINGLDYGMTVPAGKVWNLDLNGKTISGTDNGTGSFGLITNKGTLNVKSSVEGGAIKLTAVNNREWNAYSSVISNTVGGKLTVEDNVLVEHLGGTDMAYGIDNLTNGKGTSAITTIDGGYVKSTYRAIRQFLNGIEATNELYVKSGSVEGANKSVWMQDPSKNANTGKLVVEAEAKLYGDVYLTVTAGSTEWPVEVSVATSALQGESTVTASNVPDGYELSLIDGIYKVTTKALE